MRPSRSSLASLLLLAWSAAAPLHAAGKAIVVNDSNQTRNYDCEGGTAVVNGSNNNVTFRNCDKVVVNGNGSTISAGTVRALSILGNDNKVTWAEAADGRKPAITTLGSRNVVSATRGDGTASRAGSGTPAGVSAGDAQISLSDGQITIADDGGTVTVGGSGVTVSGQKSGKKGGTAPSVNVSGSDGSVTVSGGDAKVEVGAGGVTVGGSRPSGTEGTSSTRQAIVVDEGDQNRSYDCGGGTAVVNGGDNTLAFRNCTQISIHGSDNTITAVGARSLNIWGNENTVTWTEGPDGVKPSISNQGNGNHISRAQ